MENSNLNLCSDDAIKESKKLKNLVDVFDETTNGSINRLALVFSSNRAAEDALYLLKGHLYLCDCISLASLMDYTDQRFFNHVTDDRLEYGWFDVSIDSDYDYILNFGPCVRLGEAWGESLNLNSDDALSTSKTFSSGAKRTSKFGKGRCDLLPASALLRLARHFEKGADEYGDRNWEKGIPISSFVDSGMRHLLQYIDGREDEDHLCAAAWNLMCAMWTEEHYPDLLKDWKEEKK